jgi:TPP-dependent trihydroxycyclohexane-1,2-dione (THcHDO) dehydratase
MASIKLEEAVFAKGEFPVAGHGIGLEQLHALDHVHAVGLERRVGALPGIAAVKEQHLVVTAFGADRLDQRRRAVEAAEPAIGPGEIDIIDHRVGVGIGAALLDSEVIEEFFCHQMRRNTRKVADTDIGVRRTEDTPA